MNVYDYFKIAKSIAVNDDERNYIIGSVGVRSDGVIVCARNLPVMYLSNNQYSSKTHTSKHAEVRTINKMDYGGVLYVVRIAKEDESFKISRPCERCQKKIIRHKIKKVYYTMGEGMYGCWNPKTDTDNYYYL